LSERSRAYSTTIDMVTILAIDRIALAPGSE